MAWGSDRSSNNKICLTQIDLITLGFNCVFSNLFEFDYETFLVWHMINILRHSEPWHTNLRVAILIYSPWLGQHDLWPCPKKYIREARNGIHGPCSVQPRCSHEVPQEVSLLQLGGLQSKQKCSRIFGVHWQLSMACSTFCFVFYSACSSNWSSEDQ